MTAPLTPADIEGVERATIATVSPEAIEAVDGWLLAFDRGAIGRAKCAVPLRHARYAIDDIDAIERRYVARGYPPMFRLPGIDPMRAFVDALGQRGYRDDRHSLVQVADTVRVRALVADPRVLTSPRPDAAWGRVFLGEGFDPVEGASRVQSLSRAPDAVYASIPDESGDGEAIAVGAASFAFGWASIHAMRTAKSRRREGLAGRILSALGQVAIDRGYPRIFLQVEENNPGAQSLYARAGFANQWRYAYWQR